MAGTFLDCAPASEKAQQVVRRLVVLLPCRSDITHSLSDAFFKLTSTFVSMEQDLSFLLSLLLPFLVCRRACPWYALNCTLFFLQVVLLAMWFIRQMHHIGILLKFDLDKITCMIYEQFNFRTCDTTTSTCCKIFIMKYWSKS